MTNQTETQAHKKIPMEIEQHLLIKPIGQMRCDYTSRYETPRQPKFAGKNAGIIELYPDHNFEQALIGLKGFSHIWVIYSFHRNTPPERPIVMIRPPRYASKKVGVLATRSPHRPNPIGLSCVRLEKIEGRQLHVLGFDLLNETPILDIKPYIRTYDSYPEATMGWLDPNITRYEVRLTDLAQAQSDWVNQHLGIRLDRYAQVQLQEYPFDNQRKRIEFVSAACGVLAYQDWRINYSVCEQNLRVLIDTIAPAPSKENQIHAQRMYTAFHKHFS